MKPHTKEALQGEVEFGQTLTRAVISKRMGKPAVFAKNLRLLTALKGLKAPTACKAIQALLENLGKEQSRTTDSHQKKAAIESLTWIRQNPIDPKWYRRLMQRGVSRSNKTTWRHMHAIALFFQLPYEDMWDEALSKHLNVQDQISPNTPTTTDIYAQKLMELLTRGEGKFDYLKSLLDSLHREFLAMRRRKR